jgi:cytoskeletal protein RodZ
MSENLDNSQTDTGGIKTSQKKPLDWVSVALSGVAAILIIVGIYFLQQSIQLPSSGVAASSSSKSSSSQSVASVSSSSSSSNSSAVVSSSSSSVAVSSSVSASVASSIVSAPAFNPATEPLKEGATNAEIKIEITGVEGNSVSGTVTQTGFIGTRWFAKSGVFWNDFPLTAFATVPAVGETWRLELTITADQTQGAISAPGAIVVAKAYKL